MLFRNAARKIVNRVGAKTHPIYATEEIQISINTADADSHAIMETLHHPDESFWATQCLPQRFSVNCVKIHKDDYEWLALPITLFLHLPHCECYIVNGSVGSESTLTLRKNVFNKCL